MSSENPHLAKLVDFERNESVSPVPLSEPPAQVSGATSTSQSEVLSTRHLAWASLIKKHHRHLQAAVQCSVRDSGTAVTAMNDSLCCSTASAPPSYREELKAWRSSLTGEAAAERLSAYAEAMHSLATLYWEPSVMPLKKSGPVVDSNDTHRTPATEGEKRQRCSDTSRSLQEFSSRLAERVIAATENGLMPVDNPRHYCDRLNYCLQSMASYYLGEAETEGPFEGCTADGALDVAEGQLPAASSPPASSTVCVGQRRFRQLPGVFARAVKPLRRLFFQRNGRMATGMEVGELISICTPSPEGGCDAVPTETAVADTSCLSSSTSAGAGSSKEVRAARELIDADVDARAVVEESTWRRGEQTAWATALRYTSDIFHHSPGSLPAPLWVLDVGSCYGPLFGKVLTRAFSLSPVPLRVTSMDLVPYQGAAGYSSGADGVPAPRVWQADWLRMEFFGDESGAGKAARVNETAIAVGTAEEGRIRYQSQSSVRNSTDIEESFGSHLCNARDSGRGDAAHNPLTATAVRLESYDVIFFCLLLSYIPTPRLRFLACVHAFLALKEGGLLVIVSTRTQGPRRRKWMDEWSACLASIGFQRVQQSIQEKIVGISFAKVSRSAEVRQSWATAEGRAAWIESLMTSSVALEGLRITADDAKSRGVL
ncbi:hypothetical protein JKF63_04883 [Porcisia hertigi]|uniref:Probable methyltransferase BMT2 homolog n=1 Tax=Porcisia hertigi TaxID=2761500 RepID=A0A836IRS7_9TRYP|nr:hypothetical protein JKF63_04883 [Porcisia hertigi]